MICHCLRRSYVSTKMNNIIGVYSWRKVQKAIRNLPKSRIRVICVGFTAHCFQFLTINDMKQPSTGCQLCWYWSEDRVVGRLLFCCNDFWHISGAPGLSAKYERSKAVLPSIRSYEAAATSSFAISWSHSGIVFAISIKYIWLIELGWYNYHLVSVSRDNDCERAGLINHNY